MGAATTTTTTPCSVVLRRSTCPLLALLLFVQLLHTSQAFKLRGGGYEEAEKVPLAVIVPDPSPELSGSGGISPAPLAAPPPLFGGGGDDMRPRLPTERWRRGGRGEVRRAAAHPPAAAAASRHHSHGGPSPSPGPTLAPGPTRAAAPAPVAEAPAPDSGFIESSPAVPVPRGVTDTATILPMPAPGEKRQEAVGAATSVGAGLVPLLLGLIVMMASFGL